MPSRMCPNGRLVRSPGSVSVRADGLGRDAHRGRSGDRAGLRRIVHARRRPSSRRGGGGKGFNGGQLLYLAVAGCISNDLFREAPRFGVELDSVHVTVEGDFSGNPAVSDADRVRRRADGKRRSGRAGQRGGPHRRDSQHAPTGRVSLAPHDADRLARAELEGISETRPRDGGVRRRKPARTGQAKHSPRA